MAHLTSRFWTTCFGLVLSAAACIPSASPRTAPPPPPTATFMEIRQTRILDTSHLVTPKPIATRIGEPTAGPTETAPDHETLEVAAPIRYTIDASLNYAEKSATVALQGDYKNQTGEALSELVLYVPPNKQPNVFALDEVVVSTSQATTSLEGTRLTIGLDPPLTPGAATQFVLTYELSLPLMGSGYFPRHGYLGYGNHQLNLGHWLPLISHFDGSEWITPIPINIGEQETLPSADFTLALTVEYAPPGLTVVGPGDVSRRSNTWEFRLRQARDLAVTLSTEYHRLANVASTGVNVELYTLDDALPPEGAAFDGPAHALETATAAVELFADLYGPYPYDRLVVVESEFPDGMEFSGIVYVGSEWFRSYDGDPASYLTLITAHEVAHQWWYHLVGSNQSTEPWLDESLCTYSEYVFLEENYPELTAWWWNYRVSSWRPEGPVDSTVYAFDTTRAYINATYLRGASLLHALREIMGGEVFFEWLNQYASGLQHQIASADDLWRYMSDELFQATSEVRTRFLRHPNGFK